MSGFAPLKAEFAAALLDASRAPPRRGANNSIAQPALRFAVYRNNVAVGLTEALRARFPAVRSLLGDGFFDAMAGVYLRREPPRSPMLAEFGDGFAAFIEAFPPAADWPYIADVARIEAARSRAWHAADRAPADAQAFALIAPEALSDVRLALHPAATLIRSRFAACTIWAANSGEETAGEIDPDVAEDALISRPAFDVFVRRLPPGAADLIVVLARGETLGEALAFAAATTSAFEPTSVLAALIDSGAMIFATNEEEPAMTHVSDMTPRAGLPAQGRIASLVHGAIALMECVPYSALALLTRVAIAGVFWQSGQTKVDGWRVTESAIELFRSEYALPLIDPTVAAHLAAAAEHAFPVLLVAGFATRFAALALLGMTAVIQIFVYPDAWPTHGTWAACLLLLMTRGAGAISLDAWIARRFSRTV